VHGREEWDDLAMGRTVLVVDDHADFLSAATALLAADGFEVVGEAATGAGALTANETLRPQVVLLDIRLPDIDGLTVAERLAALPEPPDVVLVSSRDASTYGARLRASPARGFLVKADLSGAALRRLLAD
jgi:DNA-binding NarL/FixJ family response regulator